MRSVLALLVLAFVIVSGCSGGADPTTTSSVATLGLADAPAGSNVPIGRGDEAPAFTGELLSGEQLTLESLRGQPVVVNFWLTTCEPCLREMPLLADAAGESEDLVVVGVNYGEPAASVERYVDGFDVDLGFPILLDHDGEIGDSFGILVFPTTYFIDRNGIVQYRRVGELADRHLGEGLSRIR